MNTFLSAFAEQANRTPDAIALVHDEQSISYSDLAQQSLIVASNLKDTGVEAGDSVAIACERSIDAIAAMLGIMLNDCAFVPIDQNYPDERIAYMLNDAAVTCVITDKSLVGIPSTSKLKEIASATNIPHIQLSDFARVNVPELASHQLKSIQQSEFAAHISEDQIAYIMYTSGSTGTPKGVLISHGALHCYCQADSSGPQSLDSSGMT